MQGARTGLDAWRAGGPLWPLPGVPGAGEVEPSRRSGGGSLRTPQGAESPSLGALFRRRSRRPSAALGRRRRDRAVRAAEVSAGARGRARAEPQLPDCPQLALKGEALGGAARPRRDP